MKRVIFRSILWSSMLSLLLAYLFMAVVIYDQLYRTMCQQIRDEAEFCSIALQESRESVTSMKLGEVNATRLTLIGADGMPAFDSLEDASLMESHLDRPEVEQALALGKGSDTRLSQTLGQQTYYYAIRLQDGSVLRMSGTVDSVFATMSRFLPVLLLIWALTALVTMAVAKVRTDKLVAPLNNLDLKQPLENDVYEELSPLLSRIDAQNRQIDRQLEKLREKQEEFTAITENMKEALILVNKNALVISMNRTAQRIFHVKAEECLERHVLVINRNGCIREAVEQALGGASVERELSLNGRCYSVFANPVYFEGGLQGAVMLVLDMTEKKHAERLRQEFTANVSHELKTPLMSISGYAELMKNDMVKQEDMARFADTIFKEAGRLTRLVEDIIKLSRLDEGRLTRDFEEVELLSLAQTVAERLAGTAAQKSVRISVDGEAAVMRGVRQVLEEIVYNLTDNAIKYNVDGGSVDIRVKRLPAEKAEVMVTDTGIGIPEESRERVFERFYRVDKSHSRQTGGTGLGLSIVKHGVALHHGEISLESTVGKGTEVRVVV